MSRKKIPSRAALIEALKENDGNMAATARRFHCSRTTVWEYVNKDPELRQTVDELSESFIDEAENKLFELIRKGQPNAIIFFLKTKARHRGYSERLELVPLTTRNIEVELGAAISDTTDQTEALNGNSAAIALLNSRAPFRLFVAGAGAGKTRAGCVEILRMPGGSTGMCIAPTYRMLADSTLATFLDLTRAGGVLRSFNKTDMTAQLVNGTNILFRSADDPDRLRGTNLGWAFLDEGALATHETWLILLARLRESPGRAWVCTTPRGFDWLYETFVKSESPDYAVIRSSTRDNRFLPASFVERLQSQYTSQWQRQEIEGEFCELEGTLFKRQWFQIVEHGPGGLRWHRYWDLAASVKTAADFSASACVALDKESGDVYIRDVIKMKAEWPDVRKTIVSTALAEPGVQLGIESAMHGLAAVQELLRLPDFVNVSLRAIRVDKDKISRALPIASRAEQGKVKLVRGNWISDFMDEATSFPHGAHDDQIDAVSGAFQMIAKIREPEYDEPYSYGFRKYS